MVDLTESGNWMNGQPAEPLRFSERYSEEEHRRIRTAVVLDSAFEQDISYDPDTDYKDGYEVFLDEVHESSGDLEKLARDAVEVLDSEELDAVEYAERITGAVAMSAFQEMDYDKLERRIEELTD